MSIKKKAIQWVKTAGVGYLSHLAVRKILPRAIPGGVVVLLAAHLTHKILKK